MKKIAFLLICFGIFQFSYAQSTSAVIKGPEGLWKCSAPDAPYQYQVFNVKVEKLNDVYSAKLVGEGGFEMPFTDVVYKDSTFTMSVWVEGTPVKIRLKYDGTALKGVAITDQGEIGITAERFEATEKKGPATDSIAPKK